MVFLATLGSATLLKTDFLGSVTDQTTLAIQQELPPGTRLSTTSAAAEQVENLLRADPQVKSYLTTIGGSLSLARPATPTPLSSQSCSSRAPGQMPYARSSNRRWRSWANPPARSP